MIKTLNMLQQLEAIKHAKEKQKLHQLRAREMKLRSILSELNEDAVRNAQGALSNWSYQTTPANAMWRIWADSKRKALNAELAALRAQVLWQTEVQRIANARENTLSEMSTLARTEKRRDQLAKSRTIDINLLKLPR